MRVLQTVWAAYLTLFANLGAFLQAAIRWAFLAALVSATSLLVWETKLPDGARPRLLMLAPYLLTLIISAAGSVCLAIVWHRFIILGEPARRLLPTERDVLGPYFARACATMVLPMSLYVLVSWSTWNDGDDILVDIVLYVGMGVLLGAGARLWLALPASAVGDRATTFRQSWNATQGHGGAIFVGLVACDLPFTALTIAIDRTTGDYESYSIEAIAVYAVLQVLDLARNAVWTVFISYAYLEFVRPMQTPADHFR